MTTSSLYTVEGGYIQLPITTDPDILQQEAITAIAAELPGWVPRESHIEVLLLEQFAAMCAESAQVAASVPTAIFSYFGSLIGITPNQGAYATAQTTWTMADNKGYTIPEGTIVGYQVLGNQAYLFSTTATFTVPSGSTTTAPGAVLIQSQQIGTVYNNLAPQNLTLITALSYVASITSTTVTSGGADQETTTSYLNRLSNELQLLTPRPILPADFAELAASVAGVVRAAAFNGLNPFANILQDADSEFSISAGSYTGVQNAGTIATATGTNGGKVLKFLSSTAGTTTIIATQFYNVAQLQSYFALIEMDVASAARSVEVGVTCYDVNGTQIGSPFLSSPIIDSTTLMTFASVGFTTPANTFKVKLTVNVLSPSTSGTEYHQLAKASLMCLSAPTNQVPDSSVQQLASSLSWYGTGSSYPPTGLAVKPYLTGENGFVYTGTGAASGSTTFAKSLRFYVPAGTYHASAWIDATNVLSGSPEFLITNDAATVLLTTTQAAGVASTVGGNFTTTGGVIFFTFTTNNCTVTSGGTLTFAEPNVVLGTSGTYGTGPTFGPAAMLQNNERMVTVAAVDASGNALSPTIESNLSAYLEAQREVNFIVNVIGPAYNSIDVTWSGVATTGSDSGTVLAAANTALNAYLSPADWAGGTASPPYWDSTQTIVRYLSIVTLLGETPGMDHLVSVQIGYHGQTTLGTADIPLLGNAPLPTVGSITGNVTNG